MVVSYLSNSSTDQKHFMKTLVFFTIFLWHVVLFSAFPSPYLTQVRSALQLLFWHPPSFLLTTTSYLNTLPHHPSLSVRTCSLPSPSAAYDFRNIVHFLILPSLFRPTSSQSMFFQLFSEILLPFIYSELLILDDAHKLKFVSSYHLLSHVLPNCYLPILLNGHLLIKNVISLFPSFT